MFIRVQSNKFKYALTSFVTGKKAIVNVTVRNDVMYLQKVGSVIQDLEVPLLESVKTETSITVELTSIVKLLDETKPLEVIIDKSVMTISQDGLHIPLIAMHEERVPTETLIMDLQGEFSVYSLKQLAKVLGNLEKFAKAIGVGESMVRFDGERAIVSYSNLLYKQDFMLQPFSLSSNQVKELSRCLVKESTTVKYNVDTARSMLFLITGEGLKISMQFSKLSSMDEFETFDKISSNCKQVGQVTFSVKDKLDLMLKAIENGHLEVMVSSNDMSFTSTGVQMIKVGTNSTEPQIRISLSSVQLSILVSMMSGTLDISKGDNKIIWKALDKTLMMSGLNF